MPHDFIDICVKSLLVTLLLRDHRSHSLLVYMASVPWSHPNDIYGKSPLVPVPVSIDGRSLLVTLPSCLMHPVCWLPAIAHVVAYVRDYKHLFITTKFYLPSLLAEPEIDIWGERPLVTCPMIL